MIRRFTAFLFFDPGFSSVTHIAGWDVEAGRWAVPCGLVGLPVKTDRLVYGPTKRLCKTCDRLTRQVTSEEAHR